MAQRTVLHFPDPRLRTKALPVETFDKELQTLVDDMFETMYAEYGIGLAATQVNAPLRVIVIDLSEEQNKPLCLINPELLETHGTEQMDEGCLSVPGIFETVERASDVKVRYFDRHGKPQELVTGDLLAVCIQHEIDHLNGKLFVDYLSPLKRQRIQKKLEKHRRQVL
jgi:peptide deformylase